MTNAQETARSTRERTARAFAHALDGNAISLLLVIHDGTWTPACRQALEGTARALNYSLDDITFANIQPSNGALSERELFELTEGLDPVCCCVAGEAAVSLFSTAYRLDAAPLARTTALGRPTCLLAQLPTLLQTDDGKQKAWSLLKQLPVKP